MGPQPTMTPTLRLDVGIGAWKPESGIAGAVSVVWVGSGIRGWKHMPIPSKPPAYLFARAILSELLPSETHGNTHSAFPLARERTEKTLDLELAQHTAAPASQVNPGLLPPSLLPSSPLSPSLAAASPAPSPPWPSQGANPSLTGGGWDGWRRDERRRDGGMNGGGSRIPHLLSPSLPSPPVARRSLAGT